jgi:D-alanyl-D-alanine dipeptidase
MKLISKYLPEGGVKLKETCLKLGYLPIKKQIPGVIESLAYSGINNFLNDDLYGDFDEAYLADEVLNMLMQSNKQLKKNYPNLEFIIYDGARPTRIQKIMWDFVKDTELRDFVAEPEEGSVHNFGSAVDLSLIDKNGNSLDMGTGFDYFGELAEPIAEEKMLQEKKLNNLQIKNRIILREAMESSGFKVRYNEWWHFDAFPLEVAKNKFQRLL